MGVQSGLTAYGIAKERRAFAVLAAFHRHDPVKYAGMRMGLDGFTVFFS